MCLERVNVNSLGYFNVIITTENALTKKNFKDKNECYKNVWIA